MYTYVPTYVDASSRAKPVSDRSSEEQGCVRKRDHVVRFNGL